MKAINLKVGDKVKNQFGKILTVKSVNENTVTTYEDSNNFYHITKLFKIN